MKENFVNINLPLEERVKHLEKAYVGQFYKISHLEDCVIELRQEIKALKKEEK